LNGIFGLFARDGSPISPAQLARMQSGMYGWGVGKILSLGEMGLGGTVAPAGDETQFMPLVDPTSGVGFVCSARLDNRTELGRALNLRNGELARLSDSGLVLRAFLRWGESCPTRLFGDWSFGAWNPSERRLFLARDRFGSTGLYTYCDARVFAFASDRKALLSLDFVHPELDELYLAQVLTSWPAYHCERTIHTVIQRLPPAHFIAVTPQRATPACYWHLEDTPLLRLARRDEYAEGFRVVFDEAVRCRMEPSRDEGTLFAANCEDGTAETHAPLAITLSGGLDSGSVAATAASLQRGKPGRILAFTSVPISDTRPYTRRGFGDEFALAHATADLAGIADHIAVEARGISVLEAIRTSLEIHQEPGHAAGNLYWIVDLARMARSSGCRVMMNGQVGNAGISWVGDPFSQSWIYPIKSLGPWNWARENLKRNAPDEVFRAWRRLRSGDPNTMFRASAINPAFARRIDLFERRLQDPEERPLKSPLAERLRILKPGKSFIGALQAESGASNHLDIRDPSGDARVLAYTFSVPDEMFIDPHSGMDRWLIRTAMAGRLPEQVRLNQKRGQQAADLVPRLRACSQEVNTALDELAKGPAASYLDIGNMRATWEVVQVEDTPIAFHMAITVLTRGIMAGLFVNQFCNAA
jgi:asparagine synthase (glutamine-hydrolysing)